MNYFKIKFGVEPNKKEEPYRKDSSSFLDTSKTYYLKIKVLQCLQLVVRVGRLQLRIQLFDLRLKI